MFFGEYVNPFKEKELVWFTVWELGTVELRVYDLEIDSLQAIYRFGKQRNALHTLAVRFEDEGFFKVVLLVDDARKCARVYPAWYPTGQTGWEINYDVVEY